MPLWKRLMATLAAMLVTSFIAGLLWRWIFDTAIPSYLSGVVGGAAAVAVWELLKMVEIKPRRP